MSWHYLQEGAEACWDPSSSDGPPSALARSIPTRATSCSRDSATGCLSGSPSGTTYARSTDTPGAAALTSYPADSPARTFRPQAEEKVFPGLSRAFGLRCSESLARFGLASSLPKTPRFSALEAWTSSSKGLPAWGIAFAGECSELITSVRRTSAAACGSWPTPTTQGNELCPSMQKHPGHQPLVTALKALPTPTAKLYGNNRGGSAGRTGKIRPSLETLFGGVSLALREWMLGWPIGWTALGSLETDRFRMWLSLQRGH